MLGECRGRWVGEFGRGRRFLLDGGESCHGSRSAEALVLHVQMTSIGRRRKTSARRRFPDGRVDEPSISESTLSESKWRDSVRTAALSLPEASTVDMGSYEYAGN